MKSEDLILVLGAFKRTGTNYLRDLLCFHPACQPSKIPEDFILAESDKLLRFSQDTSIRWGRGCKALMPLLQQHLNTSLLELLSGGDEGKRVVSKTPSTEGVHNVDEIFPGAKVIFIVRDPRDTVESGRRTFEWGLKEKAQQWADGVRRIKSFQEVFPGRSICVRYEDLVTQQNAALAPVLRYCALDETVYPWELATQAPVRGSSDIVSKFREGIDWKPRKKWDNFNPIGRWKTACWTPKDMRDVDIATADLRSWLGYD